MAENGQAGLDQLMPAVICYDHLSSVTPKIPPTPSMRLCIIDKPMVPFGEVPN